MLAHLLNWLLTCWISRPIFYFASLIVRPKISRVLTVRSLLCVVRRTPVLISYLFPRRVPLPCLEKIQTVPSLVPTGYADPTVGIESSMHHAARTSYAIVHAFLTNGPKNLLPALGAFSQSVDRRGNGHRTVRIETNDGMEDDRWRVYGVYG